MMKKQSTIAKLPTEALPTERSLVEAQVNKDELLKLVKRGGRSARPVEAEADTHRITLRVKLDIFERVRQATQAREINTPITSWITEAILEKLKREHF